MKNIALKLHARGLLDNSGDYLEDTHPDSKATLYATTGENPYSEVSTELRLKDSRRGRTPSTAAPGTVPTVTGLGMREAVTLLEDAGYNVSVKGVGYVSGQSPMPGDSIPPGATVTLSLTQDT